MVLDTSTMLLSSMKFDAVVCFCHWLNVLYLVDDLTIPESLLIGFDG
jgi:hypothetical protein